MPYYQKLPIVIEAEGPITEEQIIPTLEGDMKADVGDFIITGVQGERYPCKPDIFHATYHKVPTKEGTTFVDVCIDFDGVCSTYQSGWKGADVIPDPPVEETFDALYLYLEEGLTVAIHSARSAQPGGIEAMQAWLAEHDRHHRVAVMKENDLKPEDLLPPLIQQIEFPINKPAAGMYIDDRGYHYAGPGTLPDPGIIKAFRPWNWKPKNEQTTDHPTQRTEKSPEDHR